MIEITVKCADMAEFEALISKLAPSSKQEVSTPKTASIQPPKQETPVAKKAPAQDAIATNKFDGPIRSQERHAVLDKINAMESFTICDIRKSCPADYAVALRQWITNLVNIEHKEIKPFRGRPYTRYYPVKYGPGGIKTIAKDPPPKSTNYMTHTSRLKPAFDRPIETPDDDIITDVETLDVETLTRLQVFGGPK